MQQKMLFSFGVLEAKNYADGEGFLVYPNPVKQGLINIEGCFMERPEIFDLSGRQVKIEVEKISNKSVINIQESVTLGVYILKIGQRTKKLLIQ